MGDPYSTTLSTFDPLGDASEIPADILPMRPPEAICHRRACDQGAPKRWGQTGPAAHAPWFWQAKREMDAPPSAPWWAPTLGGSAPMTNEFLQWVQLFILFLIVVILVANGNSTSPVILERVEVARPSA